MREGTVFSLSVHTGGGGTLSQVWVGGTPCQVWMGGYPMPGLDGEGTPSQVWMGGYPIPDLDGGYPSQVWMGGYPIPGQYGYPPPPRPGLDGVPPWPGLDGVPPHHDWMGYPPTIRQSIIVSTCYAAGSMPLAFTQEDFLVKYCKGRLAMY